jgi:hypothetical protein
MKNSLTPVTITDKNGRVTTVHRKTDPVQDGAKKLPALVLPQPAGEQGRTKLEQVKAERELKKAALLDGQPEKVSIRIRLEKAYRSLHQETFFHRWMDKHYSKFQIMERHILREPLQHHFAEGTYKRYSTLTGDTFLKWARLADKHYDALTTNPLADENTTGYLPGLFSARIYVNDGIRGENDEPTTDQQDNNYLLLNLAAWNSSLEGTKIRQGSGWGMLTCLDNDDVVSFAASCRDQELMQRVCTVIKTQPVTRLQEAIAIAEGDAISTLASGAL